MGNAGGGDTGLSGRGVGISWGYAPRSGGRYREDYKDGYN